ncbi:uncharacterized protein LOC134497263 [Candoia aspera]|uniref:uncharacterized protein LOC134497263 n=1 Tax=Candoia aspera TaxID=51853 RepID=UPI002FD83EC5
MAVSKAHPGQQKRSDAGVAPHLWAPSKNPEFTNLKQNHLSKLKSELFTSEVLMPARLGNVPGLLSRLPEGLLRRPPPPPLFLDSLGSSGIFCAGTDARRGPATGELGPHVRGQSPFHLRLARDRSCRHTRELGSARGRESRRPATDPRAGPAVRGSPGPTARETRQRPALRSRSRRFLAGREARAGPQRTPAQRHSWGPLLRDRDRDRARGRAQVWEAVRGAGGQPGELLGARLPAPQGARTAGPLPLRRPAGPCDRWKAAPGAGGGRRLKLAACSRRHKVIGGRRRHTLEGRGGRPDPWLWTGGAGGPPGFSADGPRAGSSLCPPHLLIVAFGSHQVPPTHNAQELPVLGADPGGSDHHLPVSELAQAAAGTQHPCNHHQRPHHHPDRWHLHLPLQLECLRSPLPPPAAPPVPGGDCQGRPVPGALQGPAATPGHQVPPGLWWQEGHPAPHLGPAGGGGGLPAAAPFSPGGNARRQARAAGGAGAPHIWRHPDVGLCGVAPEPVPEGALLPPVGAPALPASGLRLPGFTYPLKSKWYYLGIAVALLIIYSVRKTEISQQTPSTTLTDGTFTFHFNWSVYEALFPHLQHHQCREVIARDALCRGPSRAPLLLLAIKSHPASGGRRATLRRTWARPAAVGGFRLQPLFLLAATHNDKHVQLVEQERRTFGDILMWDFAESHQNLSLKECCFLQWVHQHCQQAAYVFQGDDRVFVNPAALTAFLQQTPNASQFIHGNIQYHPVVKRIGQDAIPLLLFPSAHYPHFASEGVFVMPGSALPALYQASVRLPTFPLHDAYWGFLALAAELPHQHNGHFRAWEPAQDHLTIYRQSLAIQGVSPERMEEVWQELRASAEGWPA